MSQTQIIILLATLLGAIALWLLLPRGDQPGRRLGAVLGLLALALLASRCRAGLDDQRNRLLDSGRHHGHFGRLRDQLPQPRVLRHLVRDDLAGHCRPVSLRCAQFLGVATLVVYAGAILVTFLFVLMLAQPQGHAFYDRVSWEALVSASMGAVMIGILTVVITDAFATHETAEGNRLPGMVDPVAAAAAPNAPPGQPAITRADEILSDRHMEHLGTQLFGRHLIAVEVAGTMLLAALVGAVAIAIQSKQSPRHCRRCPPWLKH